MSRALTVSQLLHRLRDAHLHGKGEWPVAIMEVCEGVPSRRDVVVAFDNDYDGDVFWVAALPKGE